MNRRSFLKYTGASAVAAVLPLSALADKASAIPHIILLQPLSPQIDKIAKAKPGMLMNTKTKEVFDSIEFVPCHTQHLYTEWRTGSSAFVGAHKWDSETVKAAKAASTQFYKYTTPDGHRLVETHYLYGLMVRGDKVVTPCVLSFSGAKIKAYRNFLTVAMATTRAPLYAFKLRISPTREHPVALGYEFYNYWIEPAKGYWIARDGSIDAANSLLPPDHALVRAGYEFSNQMRKTL